MKTQDSHIPALPHGCNSWIVIHTRTGEVIGEFYEIKNVRRFSPAVCTVKTALQHLCDLNAKIKAVRA